MEKSTFDIVVIGGGHAGVEASWISSQFGLRVGLVTIEDLPIGSMPCNPAVGGVGKGQVVREIDALGGLMGRLTDLSGIQYRILNESKGYAVQSTRVQVDKDYYAELAEEILSEQKNITIIRDKVISVKKNNEDSGFFEIYLSKNSSIKSKKVIVTTGTFLNGVIHTGAEQTLGGVYGYEQSGGLVDIFRDIKTSPARFKTGTPARLDKRTIKFDELIEQTSDHRTRNFHCFNDSQKRFMKQVSCYLTKTNERTLKIIRDNKERSPIFNGQIKGIGPRYCPSIEDKAFRYEDRNTHHVFIEPEGIDSNSIYPNGISTSLPEDIQQSFIRTISGLESVDILMYGYAVEYDVVDTSKLSISFEYEDIEGLYFAGQVNGTSGYEEAAGQGLLAGINASLSVNNMNPLILDRSESYIGVMIEDLVSNVRDEPYRLFTARSENRLYVREDNAVNRMHSYRSSLGLRSDIDIYQDDYISEFDLLSSLCDQTQYKTNEISKKYFEKMNYGPIGANISLTELLKRSKLDPVKVLMDECLNFGAKFKEEVIYSVAISKKYEGYITRASNESKKINRLGKKKINWEELYDSPHISYECRQRIKVIRPELFSQLQRIEGIRPATLAYVAGNCLR